MAEGPKVVGDLMQISLPERLVATSEWFGSQNFLPRQQDVVVTDEELRKVSFLQHPQQVMALFKMFSNGMDSPDIQEFIEQINHHNSESLALALDGVQDPGNLGTIIRIADWFGIKSIICSMDSADVYNPKVIQATMGSIARVRVLYTPLPDLFDRLPEDVPVYGTFLDGEDIYAQPLSAHGIIVMGNEGNGISAEVARHINRRMLIPNYPRGRETADSLNVAIATAITCAEFRRRSR